MHESAVPDLQPPDDAQSPHLALEKRTPQTPSEQRDRAALAVTVLSRLISILMVDSTTGSLLE